MPDQEFLQGSKGGAIQTAPLSPGGPEDLTKKALPASLPNPIFCSPVLLTNSYFYPNCDQDPQREMLLITAKAVFTNAHQNNNSKQLNKCV